VTRWLTPVAPLSRPAELGWPTVEAVLTPAAQLLGILVVTIVARWLLHRGIDGVVRTAIDRHADRTRLLPGRAGSLLAAAAGQDHERYVQRTRTMGSVLRSGVTVVVTGLGLLTALATVGVPLAPLLASAGVGGVALGFGAQSLVRDFLSGIFMIVEDQYGVGDVIDTGGVVGTVEEVSLRVTRLRDATGVVWYVRNGEITRIGNRSQGWSTATVDVPLPVTANLAQATEVLTSAVADLAGTDELVLETPTVATESVTGGAITLRITATCAAARNSTVERTIRARVVTALEAAGIELATPQG